MTVWRPWDADDDEYAERLVIKEIVPEPLKPAIHKWLWDRLHTGYNQTNAYTVNWLQSALQVVLGLQDSPYTDEVLERIESRDERFLMRVVDLCLSQFSPDYSLITRSSMPGPVIDLKWHLDQAPSAVTVLEREDQFRLGRRLPEGVDEVAEAAAASAVDVAGRHLAKAWNEAQSLSPDTSKVMTQAIRAVEAAAGPVVIPRDKRPQLSKIVGALRDSSSWTLVLPTRDDGHPDQRLVLVGMLETLAFAERQRHSGDDPTPLQAQAHVQLASALVAWFSLGVVVHGDQ